MRQDTEEQADLPEWVFSAASCLARKATAALLMPSANLMPVDGMQNHQGLQQKLKVPEYSLQITCADCPGLEAAVKQAKEDTPTSVCEDT